MYVIFEYLLTYRNSNMLINLQSIVKAVKYVYLLSLQPYRSYYVKSGAYGLPLGMCTHVNLVIYDR